MAEQHLPYAANPDAECLGPTGQQLLVFRIKLLCSPAHDLLELFRKRACFCARHHCKHLTVTVALDELHWNVEVPQTAQCLPWHRARQHIATHHDLVYLCLTNI